MDLDALAARFAAELARLTPIVDRQTRWPAALLRQRTFVGDAAWPAPLATSARVVVFRNRRVVLVRNRDGERHVTPGGRLEAGESVEDAARREVREETGWALGPLTPLGFHHFQHLGERPADFAYVWRDFVQPIFIADAARYDRAALDRTQLEAGSRLTSVGRALATLEAHQAVLLRAAVARRAESVTR
jgi:ADP-ribose pyrophosphatase YjhB (NUDIX family)